MSRGLALLVLTSILISGYIFSTVFFASRYYVNRKEGYGLYFTSGYIGTIYFIFIGLLCFLIDHHTNLFLNLFSYAKNIYPTIDGIGFKIIVLVIVSLCTCYLLPLILNIILPQFIKKWVYRSVIKENDFEILIYNAIRDELLVSFSLESGKEYVGRVILSQVPRKKNKEITILPLMSGYRDEKTKLVTYNTNYLNVYALWIEQMYLEEVMNNIDTVEEYEHIQREYQKLNDMIYGEFNPDITHLQLDDFNVVIPIQTIIVSRIFDETAYKLFKNDFELPNNQQKIIRNHSSLLF